MTYYIVLDDKEYRKDSDSSFWGMITNSETDANDWALRTAAKQKGAPEKLIFKQVGRTTTSLPTEVTVTV